MSPALPSGKLGCRVPPPQAPFPHGCPPPQQPLPGLAPASCLHAQLHTPSLSRSPPGLDLQAPAAHRLPSGPIRAVHSRPHSTLTLTTPSPQGSALSWPRCSRWADPQTHLKSPPCCSCPKQGLLHTNSPSWGPGPRGQPPAPDMDSQAPPGALQDRGPRPQSLPSGPPWERQDSPRWRAGSHCCFLGICACSPRATSGAVARPALPAHLGCENGGS